MGVSSGTGNGSIEIDFAMSVLKQNSHKNEKFLPYKVFFFLPLSLSFACCCWQQLNKVLQKLFTHKKEAQLNATLNYNEFSTFCCLLSWWLFVFGATSVAGELKLNACSCHLPICLGPHCKYHRKLSHRYGK